MDTYIICEYQTMTVDNESHIFVEVVTFLMNLFLPCQRLKGVGHTGPLLLRDSAINILLEQQKKYLCLISRDPSL